MRAFDAHLHIIDPRFPLVENQGYIPPTFTLADYRTALSTLGLKVFGGAIVSGSFQAFDQAYLTDCLLHAGPGFVGVTQIPFNTSDEQIVQLASSGVRAVRFNAMRGGSESIARIREMAERVHSLAGWHVELYIDSSEIDTTLAGILTALPSVSVDHLGLSQKGLARLLNLAEKGVRVKATGFGRTNLNIKETLKSLAKASPDCLIFGTDLPSTRAPRPFSMADYQLILDTFEDALIEKILWKNAAAFYRLNTAGLEA